jgi:hypothetical protein
MEGAGMNKVSIIMFCKQARSGKPQRTIREMADEFGIDYRILGKIMASDASAPIFSLVGAKLNHSNPQKWVEPCAMRKWWKERQELVKV